MAMGAAPVFGRVLGPIGRSHCYANGVPIRTANPGGDYGPAGLCPFVVPRQLSRLGAFAFQAFSSSACGGDGFGLGQIHARRPMTFAPTRVSRMQSN